MDTTFMATTLSPFTNYTFAVSAVTSAGAGTSVEIVLATEQDGMPKDKWCSRPLFTTSTWDNVEHPPPPPPPPM